MVYMYYGNELYHHGILGQKWGVRRYQNEDGTLTEAGKKRKAKNDTYIKKKLYEYDSQTNKRNEKKAKEKYETTGDVEALEEYLSNAVVNNVVKSHLLDPISSIDTSSLSYKQVKNQVNDYLLKFFETEDRAMDEEYNRVFDRFEKNGTVR